MKKLLVSGLVGAFALIASGAQAAPVLGGQLFYSGGDVTVTTLPVSSGYTSELWLFDASFSPLLYLVDDEPVGVTKTFNPGTYGVGVGDELVFGIKVISDGNRTYFLGGASRNADGVVHGMVDSIGGGQYVVAFEDLFGGGDLDYDDNRFLFEGAVVRTRDDVNAVPEPAMLGLLGLGLIAGARRLRRSQQAS